MFHDAFNFDLLLTADMQEARLILRIGVISDKSHYNMLTSHYFAQAKVLAAILNQVIAKAPVKGGEKSPKLNHGSWSRSVTEYHAEMTLKIVQRDLCAFIGSFSEQINIEDT